VIALLLCASAYTVDGDTIGCANQPTHIRLLGIDAPDKTSSAPCRGHYGDHVCDDAKAAAATASMQHILSTGVVKLNPVTHDRYGRLVAQVFVGRRDLQCYQLRVRAARYLPKYDNRGRIAKRCPAIVKGALR
jgi:endonuclease YncB( thermonuclease family)